MATGTLEETKQDAGKVEDEPKDSTIPGAGLDGGEKGAEAKQERMYPQSELDAKLARAGQKLQTKLEAVTAERDTLKAERETLTNEITEARESITSLTEDIERMSEDDPDKDKVVKLRKEKESELKALKKERADLEEPRKKIAQWERDQLVYSVAADFVTADGKSVDMDAFKSRADRFNLKERDDLEDLAETMGFKPKSDADPPEKKDETPILSFSGKTQGGAESLVGKSVDEKLDMAYSKKK